MKNNMDEEIITIFVIVDNTLKAIGYKDDKQVKMSEVEVITTGLVAAKYFSGVYEKARHFLRSHGYMKNMLTKGRFNIRIYRVDFFTRIIHIKKRKRIEAAFSYILTFFPKATQVITQKRFELKLTLFFICAFSVFVC